MSLDSSGGYTPKKIGNFNIPKTIIECKVDSLAFLELLLRKNIATWDEIEEIRAAVVLHLNVMYPDLQLSYATPQSLKDQAPIAAPEDPAKPLFYSAPPPEVLNATQASSNPTPNEAPKPVAGSPLYHTAQPKILQGSTPPKVMQQTVKSEPKMDTQTTDATSSTPKPTSGTPAPQPTPRIMPNIPRKKI